MPSSSVEKRKLVDIKMKKITVRRQCELLGISRSIVYYKSSAGNSNDASLMRFIDREHILHPFYGYRKITRFLRTLDYMVNAKKVRRLMGLMNIRAIYRAPRTTVADKSHKKYPYLLKELNINRPNKVWAMDITYIPMRKGFMYLTAVIDWYSRYVLSWKLSNTLDTEFCLRAVEEAMSRYGRPAIFNTDQGCQFTSQAFTGLLEANGIRISMDGKGRALDNVYVERLWRSVKYEEVYLNEYRDGHEAHKQLSRYFDFFNNERLHQSLGYQTPLSVYTKVIDMDEEAA